MQRRDLIKRGAGAIAVGVGVGKAVVDATIADAQGELNQVGAIPRHLVLMILDRSGSMSGVKESVIEGVNNYLDQQAGNEGMFIKIVQFDSYKTKDDCYCEPIFELTEAKNTPRLSASDYAPRGLTPLFAAIAEGVNMLDQVATPIDRVLMMIQTDGFDNVSPAEINKKVISNLIDSKKAAGNWTFVFMGADIDAFSEGAGIGVAAGSTMKYNNTRAGTATAYASMSTGTTNWFASTGGGTGANAVSYSANTFESFFDDSKTTTENTMLGALKQFRGGTTTAFPVENTDAKDAK